MANLISNKQIESNLRRSAFKGLISVLDSEQLEQLALRYFGVRNERGEIVNYSCPYSGKILVDTKDIVLEHIIPISSKCGTVLFNCIPASVEVNKRNEKGEKHLISWWTNSDYWDNDAPKRLEKLVNYMLEAYEVVFEYHTITEIEDSYLNIIDNGEKVNEADLTIDERKESTQLKEQAKNNGITSYLGFMLSCVQTLEDYGINTEIIRQKLQKLEYKNVFKDINRFERVQKIVQKIIKETLTDNKQSYLTYSLRISINKLLDSINFNSEEEIADEIVKRLNNIQKILNNENISLVDYYKNLQDIENINLLYFDVNLIDEQIKNNFIDNIKLGLDSKIQIFIEMVKRAKTKEEIAEIFKDGTSKPFTTYKKDESGNYVEDKTYGEIGQFWANNKPNIQPILDEKMEEDTILRDKLDDYYMNTFNGQISSEGSQRRINIFIEMLKRAKTKEQLAEIFKEGTSKPFTTYKQDESGNYVEDKTYGEIGQFWASNKLNIQPTLDKMMEEDLILRDKLDDYYMNTRSGQISAEGRQRRIKVFIEMLKRSETKEELEEMFNKRTTKPFTTYKKDESGNYVEDKTYGEIGQFWANNKPNIQPTLEKMMEEDIILRDKLDDYYMNTRGGQTSYEGRQRRINIFIEMITRAKTKEEIREILKFETSKPFTTYRKDETGNYIKDKTYGEIGQYWSANKDKTIIPQLFFAEKYEGSDYDIARQNVMNYLNSLRRKKKLPEFKTINEYIDTLDKTKKEVKALIELRDSLLSRKEQLVIENESLKEELNSSYRRAI